MKTKNIDGVIKDFSLDKQFIEYVQLVWDENELDENEANLERPDTLHEAMIYLINYTEIEIIDL